jgi:hypothetical protein
MEQQQKGLKSILLDVLGLHPGNSDRPALAQPALDPQQQEAASTAAEAAPTAPADVVADLAAAAEEEAPDQQHNVFASRLASISQKVRFAELRLAIAHLPF